MWVTTSNIGTHTHAHTLFGRSTRYLFFFLTFFDFFSSFFSFLTPVPLLANYCIFSANNDRYIISRTGVGHSLRIVFATAMQEDLTYRLYFLKIYSNFLIEVPGDKSIKLSINAN